MYHINMTTVDINTLDTVINSVRSLSKVSQDFIVHEVTQKVAELNTPILTNTQRKIVRERMSQHQKPVSSKRVHMLLDKYSI